MRAYASELMECRLRSALRTPRHRDSRSYEEKVGDALRTTGETELVHFEIEDKAMERRIVAFAAENGVERTELQSPMFTCSRDEFHEFASGKSGCSWVTSTSNNAGGSMF